MANSRYLGSVSPTTGGLSATRTKVFSQHESVAVQTASGKHPPSLERDHRPLVQRRRRSSILGAAERCSISISTNRKGAPHNEYFVKQKLLHVSAQPQFARSNTPGDPFTGIPSFMAIAGPILGEFATHSFQSPYTKSRAPSPNPLPCSSKLPFFYFLSFQSFTWEDPFRLIALRSIL